ncbi:hypothetical protein ACHAXA_011127 [Cyclostephanos tholiformis]|uniref:CDP-diacylglycerol--glycerol-3-phosphate 3-phosphatidyltransferase n=1 Tax=Cyclostephanos tholiformis TaxID=382380 RepID=A0ABD3SFC6_9STRA
MAAIGRRWDNAMIPRLIGAARGGGVGGSGGGRTEPRPPPQPLPCFPLERHHFGRLAEGRSSSSPRVGVDGDNDGHCHNQHLYHHRSRRHRRPSFSPSDSVVVATPADFHSYLCDGIRGARDRVILASLYVGVGNGNRCDNDQDDDGAPSRGGCREDELLMALQDASSSSPSSSGEGGPRKVQVLLDANRALRMVSVTSSGRDGQSHGGDMGGDDVRRSNSAEAVLSRMMMLHPHLARGVSYDNDDDAEGGGGGSGSSGSGVFLFPVNEHSHLLRGMLPSPLDEVAGVFHMKAYIMDDELLLSGANLSEEYFENRLDRYMLFTNGAGGLVDFYADLCDVLCEYAIRYDGGRTTRGGLTSMRGGPSTMMSTRNGDEGAKKRKLATSLTRLFDGRNHCCDLEINDKGVVAWAIPTIQIPTKLLGGPIGVPSDAEVTRNLLSAALECDVSASVRLSSAYLNPTQELMSILKMFGRRDNIGATYILTAGEVSHGFAPKTRGGDTHGKRKLGVVEYIKATIPRAFLTLAKETARSIMSSGGKILLYERLGWTFHAKGIWITSNDDDKDDDHVAASSRRWRDRRHPELIDNPSSLLATVIGSSNFGSRSETLDLESNCILIFNDSNGTDGSVKESVAAEWNELCESSNDLKDAGVDVDGNRVMRVVLKYMKRFL